MYIEDHFITQLCAGTATVSNLWLIWSLPRYILELEIFQTGVEGVETAGELSVDT